MQYSQWEGCALAFERDYIKTAKKGKEHVIWRIFTLASHADTTL